MKCRWADKGPRCRAVDANRADKGTTRRVQKNASIVILVGDVERAAVRIQGTTLGPKQQVVGASAATKRAVLPQKRASAGEVGFESKCKNGMIPVIGDKEYTIARVYRNAKWAE